MYVVSWTNSPQIFQNSLRNINKIKLFVEERALSNTYIRLVALSYGLHLLMMTEISVFCFVLYFCMVYYGVLYFGAYPRSRSVD